MPALLNSSVVTCVVVPEQDDDARGVQDNVVADLSGSRNDSRGPVQNVEVAIDSLLFDMIAMFIEDVADTQCRTRPNVEALAGVAQDERHAPVADDEINLGEPSPTRRRIAEGGGPQAVLKRRNCEDPLKYPDEAEEEAQSLPEIQ